MKKLLLILMVLVSGVAQAQLCGFDGAHGQRMLSDSAYRNIVNAAKARYTSMMQSAGSNGLQLTTGYGTEYQIPLVVHVIHTGGSVGTTYNPSTSTINSMITYLNQTYEATYASYPDTNSGGVRVPIKFVLAKRDPSGNSTTGINRVDGSSLSGYSLYGVKRSGSNGATDSAVKSLSVWDPADYYNIWIVNKIDSNDGTFGTYVAGYAYFPGASASVDGTVMLATTATAGNITLPHEIGHAFSLYHTFQGDGTGSTCPTNTNCTTDGDLVCDTEPHKRTLGFCGSGMTNTCVSATYDDRVAKNIMNYATCMDRFTEGQRVRMMDAMTNERSGLGSSLGVLAPDTYPKVAACTTTISGANAGNGFEMGPTQVILNDMRSSSNGYTNDNYRNYVDRSKQQRANVTAGESYTLTVQTTTNRQRVQVYIDYNNDSTFSSGEKVYDHTGTISGTENHTTTLNIPTSGITTCTPLRMRVLGDYYTVTPVTNGCGTMTYGQAEDFTIYIKPQSDTVTLTNAITSGSNPTCPTGSVTFTASASKTLTSPSYQWYVNSQAVGTNSSTYTASSLSTGTYYVQCKVGYTNGCTSADSGTTNTIALVSGSTVTPSVSIVSNKGTNICSGDTVTFTATPTNGGTTPTYQWKVNGSNVGTNSTTYVTTGLTNGQTVTCVMTSNDPCASPTSATSSGITMSVSTVTPSVSIASNKGSSICSGDTVTFTATPTNGGVSPTYQWKVNGGNVGTNSATYVTTGLTNGQTVTCEMTSNASCASPASATSSGITMTVSANVTPSVSIASNKGTSICSGDTVTFTATPTNGGTTPAYQWKVNGSNVGTNSTTYVTTGLTNGQTVTCEMTSNATCASPANATSNSLAMTVTGTVTPSVSVAASPSGAVCSGTNVAFTATPTNGGGSPTYQWKVNGGNVGTNSSSYSSSSLTNGDVVTCEMTSSATCASPTSATSSGITMTITSSVTPSVSIASSVGTTACNGQSVTFTATPTNGGTTPAYQWKVNGSNVGTNSNTYVTSSLSNGDVVTCVMTSNDPCASPAMATSNSLNMTVTSSVTPSVSIATANDTICAGTAVTFTATPTNGGTTPTYLWRKNGTVVDTGVTYITSSIVNGDTVTCDMTSNATCAVPATVSSNSIVMSVTANVTPAVSIVASPSDTTCAGSTMTFNATPVNGGTTPSYQWQVNLTNVGTNSPSFSSSTLTNGDQVRCVMTSNETCVTTPKGNSNVITTTVFAASPTVSISSSAGSTICAGTSVIFTATPSDAGPSPSYQWQVNGSPVGANSATYTTAALSNNDTVTCIVTSSLPCSSPSTSLSNGIVMTVNPNLTPIIATSVSPNDTICAGTMVKFTSTYANGGSAPSFQWKINGSNVGTNADSFITSILNNNDVVTVVMTSSETCVTSSTATSNGINMTVNPNLTPVATIAVTPNDTICDGATAIFTSSIANGGTTPTYQWQLNGANVGTNSDTFQTSGLFNGDKVRLILTTSEVCITKAVDTSNEIEMTIVPNVTPVVSIAVTPNDTICAGTSVTFTATPTNGGTTPMYQWKVNGSNVGTNSATYTTSTLADGDVVSCAMTSSLPCVTSSTALSNTITMKVNPIITPSVTISVSPNDTICAGTATTFTATGVNGGTAPTYQWKLNGSNVGTNSSTYLNSGLANGDVVTVEMTSNGVCLTKAKDTSNAINMTVIPNLTPVVIITMSPTDTVCEGTNVTFSATSANGGTSPVYQWQVNGSNVGTNSPTYSSTMLNNGDIVRLSMTSSLMCLTKPADTSNTLAAKVNAKKVPDVTITVAANDTLCAGNLATFTATPANGGSTPSYQWQVNGINVGSDNPVFATTGLSNNDMVRCIMTTSDTCVTKMKDTSNVIEMTINPITTPDVSITVSPNDTICDGNTVTFTATATTAGSSPSYQWQVNGVNVGTNSTMFATSTLSNADVVRCIVTSSDTCVTKAKDTSNSITMTVNPNVTPVITISVSPNDTICDGTSVTFSTSVANGGTAPVYQWKINGTNVGTNTSTFTTSTLANNDVVECILTSSEVCVTKSMDTSNSITMTVNPNLTPSVTITVSPDDTICAGTSTTFTAVATNGGTSATYQWQVNGSNVGTNSTTYTSTTLADGDVVRCVLTSSEVCVTKSMDTSNVVNMTVKPYVTPLVVTVVSPNDTICDGQTVTFTATGANGGTTPTYQWRLNSTNVGTNDTTYTTSTLNDKDTVRVIMTSNEMCLTKAADTSDDIVMTVNPNLTPSVTIVASPGDTICDGQITSYNATPVNGGTTPSYQWKLNGVNVGINSSGYATAGLSTGDEIECILTSSEVCVTKSMDTSNKITMFVHPLTQPSVSILANTGTTICSGSEVKFTSNYSGTGTSHSFQWRRNGTDITGETADTFTTSTMTNGDVITLRMDITAACPDPDSAVSNQLPMAVVNPSVTVSVSPNDTICENQSAMFSLMGTNVGNLPVYQWRVNGVDMVGATANVFAMPIVNNGDEVTAAFISSDNCINAPEVPSTDTVKMVVNTTTAPVVGIVANPSNVFSPNDIIWFSSSANVPNASYQWRKNGIDIPGATGLVYTELNPQDGDSISLWIRSNDTCRTPDTAISNIIVLQAASGVVHVPVLFDNVTIAPNPNNGTFVLSGMLRTRLSEEVVSIEVINTVGQVIHKEDVELKKHQLDVRIELGDKAHNGLHLIRVSAEGKKQMLKFITNR